MAETGTEELDALIAQSSLGTPGPECCATGPIPRSQSASAI